MSTVGVVANLLAAPLVAPATVAGVAAPGGLLWQPAGTALCWAGALPTLGIACIARVFAEVRGALPWPDGPPGALLLAAVTVVVLLSARWVVHNARVHPVLAVSVLLVAAAATPTSTLTWPSPGWRFVACDVGQGDALVVATTPATPCSSTPGPSRPRWTGA